MDLEARLRDGPLPVRNVWTDEMTARLATRVVRLRRRRSLLRAGLTLGAATCAVAAGLLARDALIAGPERPAEARAAAAAPPAPSPSPRAIVLRDGSRAELTGDGLLTVLDDRSERVSVRLQRGTARFSVVRNPKRRFEVESGPVQVRVVGTTFSVTRTEHGARVAVEEGRVRVSWAGEHMMLGAGETGVFPREAADEETVQRRSGWRDLARRGEYRRAYSALHGTRERVRDQPEDRLLAADVARLSGHPEQAVPHLRAVSERFAADPRAPVAAFTLGRVLLHDLDRPRQAAAAFRRARTLWPHGPLALDALASEAEALLAAGDAGGAAVLAKRYLERYPRGRQAAAMRALAGAH